MRYRDGHGGVLMSCHVIMSSLGILLGPSVLGQIPGWTNGLFPPTSVTIFGIIANFGKGWVYGC